MSSVPRIIVSWLLVIAYVVVTVAGEAVHSLDCCDAGGVVEVAAVSSGDGHAHHEHHHHHGHSHGSSTDQEESSKSPEEKHRHQPHDGRDCGVCQMLAAAQETPTGAELPLAIVVSEDAPLVSASIDLLLPRSPRRSRAPPA